VSSLLSVRRAAAEAGAEPAVITAQGGLSYAELSQRVGAVWGALSRRGLSGARPVAVRASNRTETLLVLLALIEAGIPFVPLHPRLTEHEIAGLVRDAQAGCVLGEDEVSGLGREPADEQVMARFLLLPEPRGEEPLAILYTSGTSGSPKGAVLSRAAFLASARSSALNLGWHEGDRWLLCLPLCHIGGLSIVTRCLQARRPLVLVPRFTTAAVLEAIAEHGATLLSVVPTMLRALLAEDRGGLLARLRAVLCGGAATPRALYEEAVARGVNVLLTYGLTEACSQVTCHRWSKEPRLRPGSGVALPGLELVILREGSEGPEAVLPAGQPGRICVRGPALMTGYLHRAPLGEGLFDTGDLGQLDEDGSLHVLSRRSDLIVTGGENVYPAEVEQALLLCPGVAAALVFGVPDATWGARVAAAVVPGAEGRIDEALLFRVLGERLAPFKRPRLLCQVAALPELPSGKPDRRRAAKELAEALRPFPST
jgi:O-succinylbenzoic acid--CoA ligase